MNHTCCFPHYDLTWYCSARSVQVTSWQHVPTAEFCIRWNLFYYVRECSGTGSETHLVHQINVTVLYYALLWWTSLSASCDLFAQLLNRNTLDNSLSREFGLLTIMQTYIQLMQKRKRESLGWKAIALSVCFTSCRVTHLSTPITKTPQIN